MKTHHISVRRPVDQDGAANSPSFVLRTPPPRRKRGWLARLVGLVLSVGSGICLAIGVLVILNSIAENWPETCQPAKPAQQGIYRF